jgi:hypothetical protein
MFFAARELTPYAESVSADHLRQGSVYFSVHYVDDKLLIPLMDTLVFIGKDLESGDSGQVYFQDVESYRSGVRYGQAAEGVAAQFFSGSENEVGHLFEYQQALEELMRCSLRRQELGSIEVEQEREVAVLVPERITEEATAQSLRFDDASLQARFVEELRKTGLTFEISSDGDVVCPATDWMPIGRVAGAIRDSCFHGYFLSWKGTQPAYRFWSEMKRLKLPFHVEHHQDGMLFFLPKESEALHQAIIARIADGELGVPGDDQPE